MRLGISTRQDMLHDLFPGIDELIEVMVEAEFIANSLPRHISSLSRCDFDDGGTNMASHL